MTRDDLIEQCARAAEQNFGCDCRFAPCQHDDQRVFSGVQVRALKSKLPEMDNGVAERDGLRLQVGELKLALEAAQTAHGAERAQANEWLTQLRDVRRELPQFDCRRSGGPTSDSGGKHCPQEAPCLTCRLERAEERARKAEAEVARLKWEASDAPMLGEHSGHPSTCPACRDGYPPPPGEPAPR